MTLSLDEFVRRFRLHILPARFVKIRHYGLLSNRTRSQEGGRSPKSTRSGFVKTGRVACPHQPATGPGGVEMPLLRERQSEAHPGDDTRLENGTGSALRYETSHFDS